MPKKTYKILRFDGGINNDADPRDIADHQFAELENVAVDRMGKIVVLGDANTSYKSLTGSISDEGRGLICVSTDYAGLLSGGSPSADKVYYLVENGDNIQGISSDGSETGTALTSHGITDATYYYTDGALRVADANHGGSSTPKWRGYVTAKTYMDDASNGEASITAGWKNANSAITGAFPEMTATGYEGICKNGVYVPLTSDHFESYNFNLGLGVETTDTNYDGVSATAQSDHEWGFALENLENHPSGTGTWMPTSSTRYKFYITTMYDGHSQESLPQGLRTWNYKDWKDNSSTFNGLTLAESVVFCESDTDTTAAENVRVDLRPVFKIKGTSYNFGSASVGSNDSGNERISGCRIYWASNEDGFSSLWLLFDADFNKGCSVIGADGGNTGLSNFIPWSDYPVVPSGFGEHVTILTELTFVNPPRYYQYDVLNGHSADDIINVDSYKAAVVSNRRVYIGNIEQDGLIQGDRMLKSPVNQLDKFPKVNNIDVAINDGDEIVALLEYADRILQFKKNICYIINVSGSTEYLEAEHRHKGISNPGAACRTDYGCAWINSDGCFLYDGRQVTDLLEDAGSRKIAVSTWNTFIGTDGEDRIGFNKADRQLVVKGTGTDAYIYDMVTKSWTKGTGAFDANTNSNFINDLKDGKLLIHDGTGSLDRWNKAPTASKSIVIKTKDVDFGEPAVRKKLYKVYITHKGTGTRPTVKYLTNGGTTEYSFDASLGSSSVWTRTELKPNTSSDANNIYSCQLKLSGSTGTDFEINDISFVYRMKNIK